MAKATLPAVDVRELLKAGAHFGHKTSHWHPGMKPYIHSQRGGIYIIDLIKTADLLEKALEFAYKLAGNGQQILFVGSKRQVREVIDRAARTANMPYVTQRWLGGTLTNFKTFQKRIEHLVELERQQTSNEMAESYSKREIGELKAEMLKLNISFGGLKDLKKLPAALFVADVVTEKTAVREANKLGIPVIGIVDTNGNPRQIDFVIPANDDAISAVDLIARQIAQAVALGATEYSAKAPLPASNDASAKPKASKKEAI
jgi:small subunit ribosomal protein S2